MNQVSPAKKNTVVALLFHAVVLLGAAALIYMNAHTYPPYDIAGGLSYLLSIFLGGFGLVAVWLTGEHYEETLDSFRLVAWASIHIILLILPLVILTGSLITYPNLQSLIILLPYVVLCIPPVFVIYFARRESP